MICIELYIYIYMYKASGGPRDSEAQFTQISLPAQDTLEKIEKEAPWTHMLNLL